MKNTLNDPNLKDKFSEEEKKLIETTCAEALKWIETNPNAEAAEYEAKQKELEAKFHPIMTKIYQQTGGQGMPGMPGMPGGMPNMGPNMNFGGQGGMPGQGFNPSQGPTPGTGTSKGPTVDEVD